MRKINNCCVCKKPIDYIRNTKKYCSEHCRRVLAWSKVKKSSKKCDVCGEEFIPNITFRNYCSLACIKNKRSKEVSKMHISYKKVCSLCGTQFKTTVHNKKYCSKRCINKKKQRKKAKKSNSFKREAKCEACGFSITQALHYHHINKTKKFGGITLCANCHYIFHNVAGHTKDKYERENKQQVIDEIKVIYDSYKAV